jgi:mercuric ion transport protein
MAEFNTSVGGDDAERIPGSDRRRGIAASFAAMGAAFLASLCCIGPVLFVTLGVGAGLASRFEPLRPVFSILTVGLIAVGFYTVYGRRPADKTGPSCDVHGACIAPRSRTRDKALLWIATLVALLLLTFPQWSRLLV